MTAPAMQPQQQPPKRLYRNTQDAWVAGVCSGLAEFFGIDVTVVRLLYILVSIFTAAFPGIVAYVIMWLVIPPKPTAAAPALTLPPQP